MKREVEILICKPINIAGGNYAINTISDHIWKCNSNDALVVKEGYLNGKKNVMAVLCSCRKRLASQDWNGTEEYVCNQCYLKKLDRDIII